MRSLLCVLGLAVLMQTILAAEPDCSEIVKLTSLNYGESWFVKAGELSKPENALTKSGEILEFDPDDVSGYDITFLNPVRVTRVKVQARYTNTLKVELFSEGESVGSDVKTTGTTAWKPGKKAFLEQNDDVWADVDKIHISWETTAELVALKQITIVICKPVCTCDTAQTYRIEEKKPNLILPDGFDLSVIGPALVEQEDGKTDTDIKAVMDGAMAGGVALEDNTIKMTFDSAVNILTFNIHLRDALGMTIKCYSVEEDTDDKDDLLFSGKLEIDRNWIEAEKTGLLGTIRGIRSCKMSFDYKEDMYIVAKRMYFDSCN